VARKFYEGPEPPPRLLEELRIFRAYHPEATGEEWEDFTLEFARSAYRDGFVRGVEWRERGWRELDETADQKSERDAHDWLASRHNDTMKAVMELGEDPRHPAYGLSPAAKQEYFRLVAEQLKADVAAYNELAQQRNRR
jgi:hypothetical protein